ncbi:MAG: epoxide hydrolase N-terminal domain-containing protein [Gammaproteobacteria bacterium]|nr:epoxide hydrolase N-terminal domain-containing protein [Gammaproteobacteria bacterium]
MNPEPFAIAIPQSELDDLDARLARTRWPADFAEDDERYGAPRSFLEWTTGARSSIGGQSRLA